MAVSSGNGSRFRGDAGEEVTLPAEITESDEPNKREMPCVTRQLTLYNNQPLGVYRCRRDPNPASYFCAY
jgi:hypothetical protein